MRLFNPFNKSLVGFLAFLFILYIINDYDDIFEKEGCHWKSGSKCVRPRMPAPPVYCNNYKCPDSPKYTLNTKGVCCSSGPCECSQSQCCKKRSCKYLGSGSDYSCLTADQTCGDGGVLGELKMSKDEKDAMTKLTKICDKSPTCQFIEYDGATARFLKKGACNALTDKTGRDVWSRSKASTGGKASKGNYSKHIGKAISAKDTKLPYAFNVSENLCQGYCDGIEACKAIQWEKPTNGITSKCFLKGGPIDPSKFSEGFVQSNLKRLLSCNSGG